MRQLFLFIGLFSFVLSTSAQNKCIHDSQRTKLYKEHPELAPQFNDKHEELEEFTRSYTKREVSRSNQNILIPVVFHVVHDNGEENISDAQIHEAMVQLNEDFAATNPELADVHPNFESLVANVGFQFRLADLDPNGEPTTGINRIQSELTYNGSDLALKQMVQWDPTMYLNIWVVYSSDGGNGSAFAYYPADVEGSGSIYDGVVSSYWAVGRTETAVWTHYKILTHEVGHWANLKHTWGDQSGNQASDGCSYDDGVEDTPNTIGNTGCDTEAISCGTQDNVQNYMDYSNCSSMFTKGQSDRMVAALNSDVGGRSNLWTAENHDLVFIDSEFLPRIVYNDQSFTEDFSNDGSINSTISIELIDLAFAGEGALNEGVDFSSANLPDGTSIAVNITSSTTADIIMTGQVDNHLEEDALSNIEVHFFETAFLNVAFDEIYNPSKTNIGLTFMDPYEIVFVDLVDDVHNFFEGQSWKWFTMGSGGADFGLFHYDLVNIKLETYGNGAICESGTSNISPLGIGVEVGPNSEITEPGAWYPEQLDLSNPDYTAWNGQTAYAGVEFQKNGNNHYGWIRLMVSEDGRHYYALDMAYNEAPEQAILTGEVQEPVLAYSQTTFNESIVNDGSIESERMIDVFGATWSDFDIISEGDYFSVSGTPEGLSPQLERISDTRVKLSFIGNASLHDDVNDNSYINLNFDSSILSSVASGMDLSQELAIDFRSNYHVEYVNISESEIINIANPGNEWKWFSLGVGDAEFGLWYVNEFFRFETYSKSGVCNEGTTNLAVLQTGDTIADTSYWDYFTELETQLVITSPDYSEWNGQTAYAGFKFTIAERFHYGWMRFEVSEGGNEVTLLDYAYNTKPEEYILAGQMYASYGCMDSLALNYNPNAIEDDGTCTYPLDCGDEVYMTIEMNDSYGDGWNNNFLTIVNDDGEEVESLTLNSGSSGELEFCLAEDCYTYSAGGGSYLSEISWSIYQDGEFLAYDSGNGEGVFSVNGECGCTNPEASNYNESATIDDGSCIVPLDCGIDNYILMVVDGGSYQSEVAWTVSGNNGGVGTFEFCLSDGCHQFEMTDSYGDGWNGNTAVMTDSEGNIVFEGTLDSGSEGSLVVAINTEDNCGVIITGCTDPIALNYNEDASEDDGSCEYPFECDMTILDVEMQDSYGDGWNGNVISMLNTLGDEVASFTLDSGSEGMIQLCVSDDCYSFSLTTGSYTSEISWQIMLAGLDIASGNGSDIPVDLVGINVSCNEPLENSQTIVLNEGWNMFSTYIEPTNFDFSEFVNSITPSIVIAKDYAGNAFLPEWNYNGIGDLDNTQGYQIKLTTDVDFTIEGGQLLPDGNPIPLSQGWNLIAYLRVEEADASLVLDDLVNSGNIIIAKDFAGNAFLPDWGYNGIGNMKPGQGYQIKVNYASTLEYLSNGVDYE
jgi:hypothetical protein